MTNHGITIKNDTITFDGHTIKYVWANVSQWINTETKVEYEKGDLYLVDANDDCYKFASNSKIIDLNEFFGLNSESKTFDKRQGKLRVWVRSYGSKEA